MSSQASDVTDEEVHASIEKILFTECQPCTILKLSRRANCITTQAYRCLHDYYLKARKKHDGLRPIHIVKGFREKDGITIEITRLAEAKDLEKIQSELENSENRGIYAITVGPIQDLHSLLQGDHVESPQFQYVDGHLSAVDGEELALRFRSQMSEAAEADRAAAAAANEAYETQIRQEQEAKKKPPKKTDPSIQAMFEKVQQRTSPKKETSKSPFGSPLKKEQTPQKKRGRKVVVESDDEDSPMKKISVASKKELTPVRESSKASASIDDIFDADDATPEKKPTQEDDDDDDVEEKKPAPKKTKTVTKNVRQPSFKSSAPIRKVKEVKLETSSSPEVLDTTAAGEPKRKKIIKIQGQETVLDEDGFMVTRPAMVEMEVDDDEEQNEQSQKKKDQERALKPANVVVDNKTKSKQQKPAPGGQRSISSFFAKKK
ncbi:unnamed protein product, partial [Mesorhabditis belari]|uniref:DNA polymerase delta subunit 3 n=1 Tax=Mesorhabditis belari TaxID=2138241 RepID=A0AAF3EWQ5_9BILA